MKNSLHLYLCRPRHILTLMAFLVSLTISYAENPYLSNYLVNLSAIANAEALDDVNPEMVIEGNVVHVTWTEFKYGVENWLYYCRSVDLGKTWETPKQLLKLKDSQFSMSSVSRELAVDGTNVHIGVCDYDYYNNGTGYIYYIRSINGGSTFEPVKELISTGGGYNVISRCSIRAANGKVAVVYIGAGSKNGLRVLFSSDSGGSFTEKLITEEATYLADFWYDGSKMIILSGYDYYYYGLNVGKVWVSVSADNAATFTTNKISVTYNTQYGDREQCVAYHDIHYVRKIAGSGNNIHVVFAGNNESGVWTILYARSADNGLTFEKAVDINKGIITNFQGGQETIGAKNDKVYVLYLSTGSKIFFAASADNGQAFTQAKSILPDGFSHIEKTWWPSLVIDPADETGSSVYATGNSMFSVKSSDGGKTFSGSSIALPFLNGHTQATMADMGIDSEGAIHWISEAKLKGGTDKDIFYRKITLQPQPGTKNKSYLVETSMNDKAETIIVPSSSDLNFDSAMTAEAWVKFDPSTADNISILAKLNGYDGGDYYLLPGYNMGFRKTQGKFCINTGLKTDKGEFINWGDCTIEDTLWHHIAFTYDARADLKNFKTYVDGTLRTEQIVTGRIQQGDGLLVIGSRNSFLGNTKYWIDDIRLWNRALTQEELLENQTRKFTGKEDSLKLFLNFDDTFKDITGNGNDGLPVYLGILADSNFDPPIPAFEIFKNMNQVSLNNKTANGTGYQWNFGDGNTSENGNPVYIYSTPGEYEITMIAQNLNSKTAAIRKVTIEGLSYIEPVKAGNKGYTTVSVHGGGLTVESTTLMLRRDGNPDIVGKNLYSPASGILSAQFLLEGISAGKWDIVVKNGTAEHILAGAFEVVQAITADPWVSISGRGAILFNMWQTYSINFGNNGNVDAFGVPIWFAITDDPNLEIEFIDFVMEVPQLAIERGYADKLNELGPYFTTGSVLGESFEARVYPLMVPCIPANSSMSIHIRVKTPKSVRMMVWANPPWVEMVEDVKKNTNAEGQGSKLAAAECVMGVLAEGIVDIGTSAVPGVGCVWSVGKLVYQTGESSYNKKFSMWNTLWNSAVTFVDCGINLSGIGALYKGVGVFMANMAGYAKSIKECNELGKPNSQQSLSVGTVSSFDPNEMIGPAGYGTRKWIQKNNTIPYTILFENKSTATAPAHIVTIADTLDMSVYDISNFGFGSFGWSDTILLPTGNKLKEFSIDTDLRPGINLITRVSGKLDTITGIIKWDFLSLNPSTMEIEEDPNLGFLPPNVTSPEGEGFVSFSVGLKPELKTSDVLKNKASIVFDANEPIITNEYINTLDIDKPDSRVLSLEATTKDNFTVSWTGTDKGSEIGTYTIYVLEKDTLLRPWKNRTLETSAVFVGEPGSVYKFYSIATDNVSLLENEPLGYDAYTTVTVNIEDFEMKKAELMVYPNPATDMFMVVFPDAPCGVYIVEILGINGQTFYSEIHEDHTLSAGLRINTSGLNHGQYFVRLVYGNKSVLKKISIQ